MNAATFAFRFDERIDRRVSNSMKWGGAEGHGYMRVNFGCPRATVDEAITRLKAGLSALGGHGR